jgi:hypothetical protein
MSGLKKGVIAAPSFSIFPDRRDVDHVLKIWPRHDLQKIIVERCRNACWCEGNVKLFVCMPVADEVARYGFRKLTGLRTPSNLLMTDHWRSRDQIWPHLLAIVQ